MLRYALLEYTVPRLLLRVLALLLQHLALPVPLDGVQGRPKKVLPSLFLTLPPTRAISFPLL